MSAASKISSAQNHHANTSSSAVTPVMTLPHILSSMQEFLVYTMPKFDLVVVHLNGWISYGYDGSTMMRLSRAVGVLVVWPGYVMESARTIRSCSTPLHLSTPKTLYVLVT